MKKKRKNKFKKLKKHINFNKIRFIILIYKNLIKKKYTKKTLIKFWLLILILVYKKLIKKNIQKNFK